MKGLFIVYHGFAAHSGISKKIRAQCDALCAVGVPTALCYIIPQGIQRRMVDDTPIRAFGSGLKAKVVKRISFGDILDYIRREKVDVLYIRHDHNANPFTIRFLRRAHRLGVRIAVEIPTYPYDAEFAQSSPTHKLKLRIDQLFRRRMMRYADRVVTFSDDPEIFGRPTVCISNGVDFSRIPLKTELHDTAREVHLLAVANIHIWHGIDRVIEGLRRYYASPRERIVRLHITGDGIESLLDDYRRRIVRYGLSEYVALTGPLSGDALDAQFDWCDLGVASLGRHRNGIESLKSLKNREYAARGIPFVYAERDSDFDAMPYVLKAPADDSPLNIDALLHFCDTVDRRPVPIRASVEQSLSWERQMSRVRDALFASGDNAPHRDAADSKNE